MQNQWYIDCKLIITICFHAFTGTEWEAFGAQTDNQRHLRLQSASFVCGLVLLVYWHTDNTNESAVHLHLYTSQLVILSRSHLCRGIFFAEFLSIRLCALPEACANGPALYQRLSDWIAKMPLAEYGIKNVINTKPNNSLNCWCGPKDSKFIYLYKFQLLSPKYSYNEINIEKRRNVAFWIQLQISKDYRT